MKKPTKIRQKIAIQILSTALLLGSAANLNAAENGHPKSLLKTCQIGLVLVASFLASANSGCVVHVHDDRTVRVWHDGYWHDGYWHEGHWEYRR